MEFYTKILGKLHTLVCSESWVSKNPNKPHLLRCGETQGFFDHQIYKQSSCQDYMENIGFTTGSLYLSEMLLEQRVKLYHKLGANALEISFTTPNHLLEYTLSKEKIKDICKFESISIHAPWKEIRYHSDANTDKTLKRLEFLCDKLPISGIVLHPDTIDNFTRLNKTKLPLLIENMDKRRKLWTHPEQFKDLKRKYNFGFVLDIQHAYEHDPTMQLAEEFIRVMGDRLKHIHVSGHTKTKIHAPVHLAENKEAINKILKLGIKVPKILEGILTENISNTITNELEYIKKYELA